MNITVPGIPPEHQPFTGPAPGWPLVVYFHHVHPGVSHYTALSEAAFEKGLRLLLRDFAPYPAADLVTEGPIPQPTHPTVLITFDDGYRDCFDRARPLLGLYDIQAVFFVVTDRLGTRSPAPRQDFLSWDQCDALHAEGHIIAAHTRTHPRLDLLTPSAAHEEIAGSLRTVRSRYGQTRDLFAYPYGVVPETDVVPQGVLPFGTVRSRPTAWPTATGPHPVRRTYLPAGHESLWPALVTAWRRQWDGEVPDPAHEGASDSTQEDGV
uniref:Polysaccharide deacetylase n=1 Tax=Streptomyces sp. FR1 TaxID=349971 RepID=V9Z5L3_9ACTN|nr:polysaccharide deacetylase family protein [Streptomyces sp. FR1]AHE38681.1 Polysaccharide deacetylase [Streptomyces sp. FR1]